MENLCRKTAYRVSSYNNQLDINPRGRLRDSYYAIVPFYNHFPQRSVTKFGFVSQSGAFFLVLVLKIYFFIEFVDISPKVELLLTCLVT